MRVARVARDAAILISRLEVAETTAERMRGLLGREGLEPASGLLLAPCTSIHTWFMQFSLDLVFISSEWRVTRVVRRVPPFRAVRGGAGAWGVIEVEHGWLDEASVRAGDRLTLQDS